MWERLLAWIVPDYPIFLLDHSFFVLYQGGPLYFESYRP